VVSSTPRPHFTPGTDRVPIFQEAGWAPGPVWTGGKSRPHWDSIPDCPVRSSVAIPTELPGPHTHTQTHTHIHTHTHIYIYIYRERERERERDWICAGDSVLHDAMQQLLFDILVVAQLAKRIPVFPNAKHFHVVQ